MNENLVSGPHQLTCFVLHTKVKSDGHQGKADLKTNVQEEM